MKLNLHIYLTHPHVACWNFQEKHRALLEKNLPDLNIQTFTNSKPFLAQLPEADLAIVWFFKKEWQEQALRLRLISTPAAGRDWIQLPKPEPENVGTPGHPEVWFGGFHGSMMAESVLGAALYFLKAFPLSTHMQNQKKWGRIKISDQIGSLHKARVTILGFGRIGRDIGRVFKPFGCRITGVQRHPSESPDYFDTHDRVVTVDKLTEILPETDHLILALPGGESTDGMLTRDLFSRLNGKAIFYNVGRGNPYKEEDLVWALSQKKIHSAYLDVFDTEPLPESSVLWYFGNVLIQPHLSAASPQYLDLYLEELIGRLKRENFLDKLRTGPVGA